MVAPQTCPICDRPLERDEAPVNVFPFCSVRCRNVDLFRWWDGRYAITEPLDPESMAEMDDPADG